MNKIGKNFNQNWD